jgi:hypothetical protein
LQLEAISVRLRPRAAWEGCDLGVCLLQSCLRWVYPSYLLVALPLFALCIATGGIASWLPTTLMWIFKPWLDRTLLFALSRALFGEATRPVDVWNAQGQVWWSQLPQTFTLRRLSASRSFTQPVAQLEHLSGATRRRRVRQLAARQRGIARAATQVFASAELALVIGLLSLGLWLAPERLELSSVLRRADFINNLGWQINVAYAAAIAFVEPFYVAAGFGMYINRRVELEAWDIEQEFRRVFAP